MDCVRLALVNLYKVSPKQAHQNRFFLCVFTIYSSNRNPIYKLSAAFKRTEHVEGDHDLIVRARLQFGMHGLSCLFSLTPLKTSPILDVKAAFLVAFYYTFEAYNLQRI